MDRVARRNVAAIATAIALLAATPSIGLADAQLELVSTGPLDGHANGDCSIGVCDSYFIGGSADATRVFFRTGEQLLSEDQNGYDDHFERHRSTTTLMTRGNQPTHTSRGWPSFLAASRDGTRFLWETTGTLLPQDTDTSEDIYQRAGGVTTLVSTGPAGGNGGQRPFFAGISEDGTRVFFETTERLTADDIDTEYDVYERTGAAIRLVSSGTNHGTTLAGLSADGNRTFLYTGDRLTAADTDDHGDIYRRDGSGTVLVTTDPTIPSYVETSPFLFAVSPDGDRALLQTMARYSAADEQDTSTDFYVWEDGRFTLVSTGPGREAIVGTPGTPTFAGASRDLSRVYWQTEDAYVAGDRDSSRDVYGTWAGETHLVSATGSAGNGDFDASMRAVSDDGRRAFFSTHETLTSDDLPCDCQWPENRDVYEYADGQLRLATLGTPFDRGEQNFGGISRDGRRLLFEGGGTWQRSGGVTERVAPDGSVEAVSEDGSRVVLESPLTLAAEDRDHTAWDVFVAHLAPLSPLPPADPDPGSTPPPSSGPGEPPPSGAVDPTTSDGSVATAPGETEPGVGSSPYAADVTPPRLSRLRLTRRRFRAEVAGTSPSPRAKAFLVFRATEAGVLEVTFKRAARRRGCRAGRCVRWRRVAAELLASARSGRNVLAFSGRLEGGTVLAPGRYRLLAHLRDAAGNQSDARSARFTLTAR